MSNQPVGRAQRSPSPSTPSRSWAICTPGGPVAHLRVEHPADHEQAASLTAQTLIFTAGARLIMSKACAWWSGCSSSDRGPTDHPRCVVPGSVTTAAARR